MTDVVVYKNRTNILRVDLGFDVSDDTITSEIREKANTSAPLVATWDVEFETDGTDGKLILTLDDSELSSVTVKSGYMDLKRVSAGEPLPVFDPVKVVFKESVTA